MKKILLILILLIYNINVVNAIDGKTPSIEKCIKQADIVFIGFVIESSVEYPIDYKKPWKGKTKLNIIEILKGELGPKEKFQIYTEFQPGNRFKHLQVGNFYIIFSTYDKKLKKYIVRKFSGTSRNVEKYKKKIIKLIK